MQKQGFPGMKSLDHLRSLGRSAAGSAKSFIIPSQRPSLDSVSLGSFANLKLTAEKLVKEQASVKTDLELAHSKLKKSAEQICMLEAKLQDANNENAKLKVKQKEDAKLWKGLDAKLSSTKMLCDQLTETLQHLASQTQDAEEDKKSFEEKISENLKVIDDLDSQLRDLSAKLENAMETLRNGQQELMGLRREKEEMEKEFRDERSATEHLMREKDTVIKQLKGIVEEDKVHFQTLNSNVQELQNELKLKEDTCKFLRVDLENMDKEKNDLLSRNDDFARKLLESREEIEHLEDTVHGFMVKVVELDSQSMSASSNAVQLISSFETCCKLVQQEKDLAMKCAQSRFDQLQNQFLNVSSENHVLKTEIEELKNRIMEQQKAEEFAMVQHAEECRIVEEKIRKLESEAESFVTRKKELEMLVAKLEQEIKHLSEAMSLKENQMCDLLQNISKLEFENQCIQDKMELTLQEKAQEIEMLHNDIAKREHHGNSLDNQISQLSGHLDEKEQLNLQLRDREKQLEEKLLENHASLASAECKLTEAKKQYDLMLDSKQLELTKHLKEISQRNDQAINDIKKKYEVEKLEIVNAEKEKADNHIRDMQRKYDEKVKENKEEAHQHLMCVQKEHAELISRVQLEHDHKESDLRAHHNEELQRVQLQAESELREKTLFLKKEHEMQVQTLKYQYEEECKKLHEELGLQKSKEERQRKLLQLQWKVMDEKSQHDDLEVNSKKEHSVSSIKMRGPDGRKGSQLSLTRPENLRQDITLSGAMRTPLANILNKVEKGNPGSVISIPKHSKKVTRHEYEVETANGRTITKRRKTKSTVMFENPNTHKRANRQTPKASADVVKKTKDIRRTQPRPRPRPSPIGDLFSEGSLNPYTDDPYAFD